ncbi:hypothetical protein [Streptomyces sp. NBC_01276]|uniref:hypothetical protein n=1 Tax=Streptomyces sp. NBC_01276 TaxID=2903808 RepID=UPI002F917638
MITGLLIALVMATIMVTTYVEEAAKAQGRQLALKVTNKLPEQDPLGVVPGIAVFVLLGPATSARPSPCSPPRPRPPAGAS